MPLCIVIFVFHYEANQDFSLRLYIFFPIVLLELITFCGLILKPIILIQGTVADDGVLSLAMTKKPKVIIWSPT